MLTNSVDVLQDGRPAGHDWQAVDRQLRATRTRQAVDLLGDRLSDAIALGTALLRVNRRKADAFFRAHPALARAASKRRVLRPGTPVLAIVQHLLCLGALSCALWYNLGFGFPLILVFALFFRAATEGQEPGALDRYRRDEKGGEVMRGIAWVECVIAVLYGMWEFAKPSHQGSPLALTFTGLGLYCAWVTLRYDIAASAARQLLLTSHAGLEALSRDDVIEVRYEPVASSAAEPPR